MGAQHYGNRQNRSLNTCSNYKQYSLGESFKDPEFGFLPFPAGELFLSGQHHPLVTRSLQWHTAGWHQCYSNSRCGRWPWFSSPWSSRTTSWLLPHAVVAGGGTQFGLLPVSTGQLVLEIGRHRCHDLLSSYLGKAGRRGLQKGSSVNVWAILESCVCRSGHRSTWHQVHSIQ